jgi:RND family efflux transporter MFP subunit
MESSYSTESPAPLPGGQSPPDDPRTVAVAPAAKRGSTIPLVIGAGVVAILIAGFLLIRHAESKTNKVALSSEAQPVSVVVAVATSYRPSRTYVGRLDPWVQASVGPQFISAYVDTVLVRPGAVVKAGQVLATLDCRNENAMAQAVAMEARALDEQQTALSHESTRVTSMLDGGFVSPNEAEMKSSQSSAKRAEVLAQKAKLIGSSLEVKDCILRAPFDGDVAVRTVDPGAFVRPGGAIVSVVDRSTVRMTADVPENDFDSVVPGKNVTVHVYATGKDFQGAITRRAPAADPSSRTIRIEVDLPDPNKVIPVGTTGQILVDVGEPAPAVAIPLSAAKLSDEKATIFFVDGDTAHTTSFKPLGEAKGNVYASLTAVRPGTRIVTEGRSLLREGERVLATTEPPADSTPGASALVPSSAVEATP